MFTADKPVCYYSIILKEGDEMKKKLILVFCIAVVLILLSFTYYYYRMSLNVDGLALVKSGENIYEVSILDLSTDSYIENIPHSDQALFLNKKELILFRSETISLYSLETGAEEIIYKNDYKEVEQIAIRNNSQISFIIDEDIILYDLPSRTKRVLIKDNAFVDHTWSDDGKTLFYETREGFINAYQYDLETETVVAEGRKPDFSSGYLAYTLNNTLIVKNISTGEETECLKMCTDYCFSPDGSRLLITSALSYDYFFSHIWRDGLGVKIFGYSVYAWEHSSGRMDMVIDYSRHLDAVCDWN